MTKYNKRNVELIEHLAQYIELQSVIVAAVNRGILEAAPAIRLMVANLKPLLKRTRARRI